MNVNMKHVIKNTCIGCGIIICPFCLYEPSDCRCVNKGNCCKKSD